jgi:hypothetical protein
MYIQKRKNAFYLRESVWDTETKKPKTLCKYLASDPHEAKLRVKEIAPSEYLELAARIDELCKPTAAEVKALTARQLNDLYRQATLAGADELAAILLDAHDKVMRTKINTPSR